MLAAGGIRQVQVWQAAHCPLEVECTTVSWNRIKMCKSYVSEDFVC